VQLKQYLYSTALDTLLRSYAMAKEEGQMTQGDLLRFKVAELHSLCNFYNEYNSICFPEDARISVPKSIKNENLIEVNLNAFQETYEMKKEIFKEVLGNLNWSKFSERIRAQLKSNQNLTAEQKKILEVNSIVALIKAHQVNLNI